MEFTAAIDKDDEGDDSEPEVVYSAASSGRILLLQQAIAQDPTLLEYPDDQGQVPLMHAVAAQQLNSVKMLIKMGASIDAQDGVGRTCLALAAYQGWHEGVMLLLRNGAKRTICDKWNRSPLHCCTYNEDTRVLSSLLRNMKSTEVNHSDCEGMTALHWAAFHEHSAHLALLLAKDADVFLQDVDGKTALHWAAQNVSPSCCRLLTSRAANLLDQPDYGGKTALHCAAAAGRSSIVRLLGAHEQCDVNAQDMDERTPLHWAAATAHGDVVATLLELRADPTIVDVDCLSPLQCARQVNDSECVRLLETVDELAADDNHAATRTVKSRDVTSPHRNALDFFVDTLQQQQQLQQQHQSEDFTNELHIAPDDLVDDVADLTVQNSSDNSPNTSAHRSTDSLSNESSGGSRLSFSRHDIEAEQSIESLISSRVDKPHLSKHDQRSSSSSSLLSEPSVFRSTARVVLKMADISRRPKLSEDKSGKIRRQYSMMDTDENDSPATTPPSSGKSSREMTLAPLKGPIPPKPGALPSVVLNKRLDILRQERSGKDRPPTPPYWSNEGMSASRDVNNFMLATTRRQKNKIRSRCANAVSLDSGTHDDDGPAAREDFPPADGHRRMSSQKSDRTQRKREAIEAYMNQRASMDKDMRSLLH